MNRVPQNISHPGEARSAGTGDWVSPIQASSSRRTSWRDLLAGIWPIHRALLFGCLGADALLALGLLLYRQWAVATASDVIAGPACRAGAALDGLDCLNALSDAQADLFRTLGAVLTLACPALAAGAGVILGVSTFARDVEQRTQVFLLTQSVSRARWWAAKTALVLVPWALAMLVLGAVASWAFEGAAAAFAPLNRYPSVPMTPGVFYPSLVGLVTVGMVAVCVGVTAGILLRGTLGAILVAGLVTAALIGGAEVARPHLVPVDRFVSAYSSYAETTLPDGSWYLKNGSLDAAGQEVALWTADCSDLYATTSQATTVDESIEINRQCAMRNGVVTSYTDVIVPSRFGLLRLLWSGGLLTASVLVLLGGLLRIRRRVL